MGNYHFRIECEENGFCFKLYPNNFHRIPMGISNLFPNRKEAEKGLENFKFFIKSTPDIFTLFAWKKENELFKYCMRENIYSLNFVNKGGYTRVASLKDGLLSVKRNIDATIKIE